MWTERRIFFYVKTVGTYSNHVITGWNLPLAVSSLLASLTNNIKDNEVCKVTNKSSSTNVEHSNLDYAALLLLMHKAVY